MDKEAEMSQGPEQIRSFIAIELPEEAREGLARLRKELEPQPKASSGLLGRHRWGNGQAIQVTARHRLRARRPGIC
jgi:hypothetical protein